MQPVRFQHISRVQSESPLASNAPPAADASEQIGCSPLNRLQALGAKSVAARARTEHLIALAKRGLPRMHRQGAFAHTLRSIKTSNGRFARPEGDSLRYATIVALGVACVDEWEQRQVLAGSTAQDLALIAAARANNSDDPGAIALAAWAAAEVANFYAAPLFQRLSALLASGAPIATVDCSWTLVAAIAARQLEDTDELTKLAANRLLEGQGAAGLFPHMLPASANGRLRAHVGCFADQVYPIQALARLHTARNDHAALTAAEACAARICALQGPAGQWWWHYDARDGSVVERYPVYSVHQHAMGPMALLDLREAGGTGYLRPIMAGLTWLDHHPEVNEPLVSEQESVVWRKVGRREPRKAVRAISAITTAMKSGLYLPGLDTVFPANQVDYECRPYEFGVASLRLVLRGAVDRLRPPQAEHRS